MFCRGYVESKLNLGRDSETRFGQDFEVKALRRGSCLVKMLRLMLGRDSEYEIWSRYVFELLIWTQPSGPLCLWQCFQLIPSGVLILMVWAIFSGCSGGSRSYPFSAVCFPVGGLTSPTSRPVPSSNQQPSPSPCSPQNSACQKALEKYTLLLLLTP